MRLAAGEAVAGVVAVHLEATAALAVAVGAAAAEVEKTERVEPVAAAQARTAWRVYPCSVFGLARLPLLVPRHRRASPWLTRPSWLSRSPPAPGSRSTDLE